MAGGSSGGTNYRLSLDLGTVTVRDLSLCYCCRQIVLYHDNNVRFWSIHFIPQRLLQLLAFVCLLGLCVSAWPWWKTLDNIAISTNAQMHKHGSK
jgi:hypothetical protein